MEGLELHTWLMIVVFIIGYIGITIEHVIKIDKATIALLAGVIFMDHPGDQRQSLYCGDITTCLAHHVSDISQIIFFLLGALLIVEMISVHKGFSVIADVLRIDSKRSLLWVLSIITFFLCVIQTTLQPLS